MSNNIFTDLNQTRKLLNDRKNYFDKLHLQPEIELYLSTRNTDNKNLVNISFSLKRLRNFNRSEKRQESRSTSGESSPSMTKEKNRETLTFQ